MDEHFDPSSIEDRLHYDMCPAVCRPGLFRTPHCSTSPSAPGPAQSQRANVSTRNFQFQLAVGRNPRTGTFCASKGELRTSYNILQWTYRYSIPLCRSRAPSASMTLPVAMSRSQASLSWIHTDDAGKGPRSSTYSKASEFPIAQKKSVGVSWITFLLVVKYVHFM